MLLLSLKSVLRHVDLQAVVAAAASASSAPAPRRWLNVHEHVGMELMRDYDIPVPRGSVAETPDEAEHVYSSSLAGGGEPQPRPDRVPAAAVHKDNMLCLDA